MAAKGTWQDKVDLTLITSIPDGAIGYKISIGGCTSSVSSKRYFYNELYPQETFSPKLIASKIALELL